MTDFRSSFFSNVLQNKEMENIRSIFNEDPDNPNNMHQLPNSALLPNPLNPSYLVFKILSLAAKDIHSYRKNLFQYGLRLAFLIICINSWRESEGDCVSH